MVLSDRGAAVVQINRATEPNAPEINLFSPFPPTRTFSTGGRAASSSI
jgi:hypothetical protein